MSADRARYKHRQSASSCHGGRHRLPGIGSGPWLHVNGNVIQLEGLEGAQVRPGWKTLHPLLCLEYYSSDFVIRRRFKSRSERHLTDPEIDERLTRFRSELRTQTPLMVTHRSILSGGCYALTHDQYMSLRETVANHFSVPAMEVVVVGSSKLGFSIAPSKRYRHFGETSDIDVAIASTYLFEEIWKRSFDYYLDGSRFWDQLNEYQKHLFRGWIRPELLPPSGRFSISKDWWDFFRSLTASGEYGPFKITGALYRSWYHLERYQARAVDSCQRDELEERW